MNEVSRNLQAAMYQHSMICALHDDEDLDIDSVALHCLQSSFRTRRRSLQPKWRFMDVKSKSGATNAQFNAWLIEYTKVEMEKAGP
jgi:hypothetical protein